MEISDRSSETGFLKHPCWETAVRQLCPGGFKISFAGGYSYLAIFSHIKGKPLSVTTIKTVTQLNCMAISFPRGYKHTTHLGHGPWESCERGFYLYTLKSKQHSWAVKNLEVKNAMFYHPHVYCVIIPVQIQVHGENQQEEEEALAHCDQSGSLSCPAPPLAGPACSMLVVGCVHPPSASVSLFFGWVL